MTPCHARSLTSIDCIQPLRDTRQAFAFQIMTHRFISGSCLRVDGAMPKAKRVAGGIGSGKAAGAFEGCHLAKDPKVLG